MIGLNGSLSIASEALSAQYAGLEVANNNIANANTPGYTRQVVSLSSAASLQNGVSVDEGVTYNGYISVRDEVLNLAINAKTSDNSSLTAQSAALTQVNTAFSGTTSGIGASISTVFSDLSALSTDPSDPSARQAVLTDANELVGAFHQGAAALSSAAGSADQQVTSTVAQINQLTQQIASLNGQLAAVTGEQDGGTLEDQRDSLTTQLAQLVGISSTQTETTPSLTTTNGSPLVVGAAAYALQVTTAPDGTAHVLDAQGNDITNDLTGGTLGGAITVRDSTLPGLSQQLDALASQFATAMNDAQASGFDANGIAGTAMFSLPTDGSSAAAGIGVALTSGSGIAVSSDGSGNSSGNLQALLAVQTGDLPSGATPSDSYANLVDDIGSAGSQVSTDLTATTASLQQLTTQQSSESGVSIDEETTNLIRYQQAYTAAAKVISTLTDLYTVLMNMTTGAL
jgi:flagellar hook-associated protein 1 FlgK